MCMHLLPAARRRRRPKCNPEQSPGIADSLTYIAKLYNQELHLLARPDIKRIADLSGQTVNVDVQGSSTAFTAARVFNLLGIKPKIANDSQDAALQKLRNGSSSGRQRSRPMRSAWRSGSPPRLVCFSRSTRRARPPGSTRLKLCVSSKLP